MPAVTEVLHGCDALGPWLADRPDGDAVVVTDPAIVGSSVLADVDRALQGAGRRPSRIVLDRDPCRAGVAGLIELTDRLGTAAVVVAMGGGTVLDQAKLALLAADRQVRTRLSTRQRSGLLLFPAGLCRRAALVAVPTTLGTGSEVSAAACFTDAGRKRLVLGPSLQPDAAVLAKEATAGLPATLVAEGVLEAAFRCVGPYAGCSQDRPTEDAITELTAVRLVELGHQVARTRAAGRSVPGSVRLEIAILSGLTHGALLHRGRDPFAVRGWPVANELSVVAGVRKMTAVAAVLPPLWRAITDGAIGWGSADRLRRIWIRIAATDSGLPPDPSDGLATLLSSWRIRRHVDLSPAQVQECAERVVHGWGGGLPMLGRLGRRDVAAVLRRALTTADAPVAMPV
jgi:hypothetical protein